MEALNLPSDLFSQQLNVSFLPMVDGKLIQSDPLTLLQSGKYARVFYTVFLYLKSSSVPQVPVIAGVCEDEGT